MAEAGGVAWLRGPAFRPFRSLLGGNLKNIAPFEIRRRPVRPARPRSGKSTAGQPAHASDGVGQILIRGERASIAAGFQTALISKSGIAWRAGIWAMEANPRLGFAPTIPTRIFLVVAMASSPPRTRSYRCTSSIMMPSGPRMKARRRPGLRVSGRMAISAPLARNSATAASTSLTVRPICSNP